MKGVKLKKISEKRGDLYVIEDNGNDSLEFEYYYIVYNDRMIFKSEVFSLIVMQGAVVINNEEYEKGTLLRNVSKNDKIKKTVDFIGLLMSDHEEKSIYPLPDIFFTVKRVFFVDNMPVGAVRGAHAHKIETEFLFVVKGEFNVRIKGKNNFSGVLKKNDSITSFPNDWTYVENLKEKGVLLALLSHKYDERGFYNKP